MKCGECENFVPHEFAHLWPRIGACKYHPGYAVLNDHECRLPSNALDEGVVYGIKDSGERTEFETGAVRDMHAGKGRMDLLPWRAVIEVSQHCEEGAKKYGEHNVDRGIPLHSLIDSGMRHLAKFIVGLDDEPHLRAAAWNILWALEMLQTHPELNDLPAWKGEDNEGD